MSTTAQLNAFEEAKKNAETNEQRILRMIKGLTTFGATKKELEGALGMKHQTVTSRLSSLRDQGKIYMKETDEPKLGCTTWYATPEHLIEHYKKKQADAKFEKWLRSGMKNFGISKELAGRIATMYNEQNFGL